MDIADILNQLKEQRDAINTAITALDGARRPNGRRRSLSPKPQQARRPRRKLGAAAKKRLSVAAKARWAMAKKAGRNAL